MRTNLDEAERRVAAAEAKRKAAESHETEARLAESAEKLKACETVIADLKRTVSEAAPETKAPPASPSEALLDGEELRSGTVPITLLVGEVLAIQSALPTLDDRAKETRAAWQEEQDKLEKALERMADADEATRAAAEDGMEELVGKKFEAYDDALKHFDRVKAQYATLHETALAALVPRVEATEKRYEKAHAALLAPSGAAGHVRAVAKTLEEVNDRAKERGLKASQGAVSADAETAVLPGAPGDEQDAAYFLRLLYDARRARALLCVLTKLHGTFKMHCARRGAGVLLDIPDFEAGPPSSWLPHRRSSSTTRRRPCNERRRDSPTGFECRSTAARSSRLL